MAINKVIMTGRLTACPELKQTPSGVTVCSFTIAQNNGKDRAAEFFDCIAWRQTAEFLSKYFRKGDGIEIVGRLQSRAYEKDNVKRKIYEVVCDVVSFSMGKANSDDTTVQNSYIPDAYQSVQTSDYETDDDVPF